MLSSTTKLSLSSNNKAMRHYAPYDKTKQKSQKGKKKERVIRLAKEWDIRIDAKPMDANKIVATIKKNLDQISYVLVSGVENPESAEVSWGSKEQHVHIALIAKDNISRDIALILCRGFPKTTSEYAVPRNTKFTYAGWYMHHTKTDLKLVKEPALRFEHGVLPQDLMDNETCKKVRLMFKKFGMDSTESKELNSIKFAAYLKE
jgi:hypothetical protein